MQFSRARWLSAARVIYGDPYFAKEVATYIRERSWHARRELRVWRSFGGDFRKLSPHIRFASIA